MTEPWHIDTIDPSAGRAFVSRRTGTLLNDAPLEDAPVFFIGAPSFTPQPIASRGIAMAAERYRFQLGLFDSRGEIPFETLEDVAEFVRRAYLSSERGSPSDPSSTPPLPIPNPESPLSPEGSFVKLEAPTPLADAVARFRNESAHPNRGEAKPVDWSAISAPTSDTNALLLHGATILMREILVRFPEELNAESRECWRRSAVAFSGIVQRLNLLLDMASNEGLQRLCYKFLQDVWWRVEEQARDIPMDNAVACTLQVMTHQTIHSPWFYDWQIASPVLSTQEPIDELTCLPIPSLIAKNIHIHDYNRASVATLLSVVLASPNFIAGSLAEGEIDNAEAEAILLFAASRVVAVDGASFLAPHLYIGKANGWDKETATFRREKMLEAAMKWISHNLPSRAFDSILETMISGEPATEPPPPGETTILVINVSTDKTNGKVEAKAEALGTRFPDLNAPPEEPEPSVG